MLRRALVPTLAVLLTGLALYLTRGVLDQVVSDTRAVRVALLPPWQTLAGFTVMAGFGLLWLARRAAPRAVTSAPVRLRIASLTLPAFALGLLVVPYLPILPDAVPALQLLAGPLRWIVWLTVGGLFWWTLWQVRIARLAWIERCSVLQVAVLMTALTAGVATLAAARLTGTVLFPSDDEPHYLVIAQSLWRDGDLKIENNHTRGDYREYFPRDLEPHFLRRGTDGEIYSIHPIGMPLLMAPVYGLGGYRAVVIVLILCAAAAAGLMWRSVVGAINAAGAATFAWAAIALTTPFLFNTFTVYPEIVAALAVVVALTRSMDGGVWPGGVARWLIVGLACAALPWLSTKYAPMSAMLVLITLARIWRPPSFSNIGDRELRRDRSEPFADTGHRERRRDTSEASAEAGLPRRSSPLIWARAEAGATTATVAVLIPYVASLAGWFAFFYVIWGTPLPQAPYGDLVQTDLKNLIFGVPGLLFDQEYGLLAYAPVYILAATGLVAMWRDGGELRRRAIEILLAFLALMGTVGAFRIWWGGTASPGRPLAAGLLMLALPIAAAARAAPRGSARQAGHQLLLWVSVAIAFVLMFARDGFLISNGRDGTSSFLEYVSPRWEAWTRVPTFIAHEAPTALLHSAGWLMAALLTAAALSRWRTRTPGASALAATAAFALALLALSVVMPRLPADPPLPRVDLQARAELPMLDNYDVVSRPLAIRYDPVHLVPPIAVERLATLDVAPGTRRDPQPIRVIHNARFSLPAGRYGLSVRWTDVRTGPTALSMQVGRTGDGWRTWMVTPQPGSEWQTEFTLPADAGFVGFRGTTDLERAIAHLTVTPVSIVNAGERPSLPPILAAMEIGDLAVFFHDEQVFAETYGFWVKGQRRATISIARVSDSEPLELRIHSGVANRAVLSMRGWEQVVDLRPVEPVIVAIPDSNRRVLTLDIAAQDGFTPRDLDPASPDPRYLGVWVSFPGVRQAPAQARP